MSDRKQEKPAREEYPGQRPLIDPALDQPEVQEESLKLHGDKLEQAPAKDSAKEQK